ncbi:MAG: segregation/condensation protein A [Candidatus Pacebacteria bacterium]|nr:segregation/condensation protein A [Candidatus Paceibacterota bacterium]
MDSEYTIKTQSFEGPLGLLLDLIEKRKLFINDISLSVIADDYIEYIRNRGSMSIRESSEFILIASALMLIKSKSLLPNLNLSTEEEQSIEDLENRLRLYKRFRELSIHVNQRFGKNIIFAGNKTKNIEIIFSPDKHTSVDNLFSSIVSVITKLPKKEIISKGAVRKVISLEEMIDNLTERIKRQVKMSFSEFSGNKTEKINVVVSFLAVLELVKQGIVAVKQTATFGEIDIENTDISTPVY